MALVAAGLIDVNGDLIDTVRSVTCAAEASVGAGSTISDGGASRFIAETHAGATAAGERIDMGAIAFMSAFTWVVRFVFRTGDGGAGNYEALISRGGVFENNTQASVGWRGTSLSPFQYQRSGGALRGSEASGQPSLVAGTAYTLVYRVTAGSKQLYYCGQDIGGAGIDFILVASSTDGAGADGSQHVFLGGPNTFTDQDRSINAGILGALIYNHRVSDVELAAIALDGATGFYAQIPSGGTEHEALSCTPGAVAITGQSATLRAHRVLTCSPGAINVSGQAATLRAARQLVAQAGTVAVTGTQATLRATRQLVAQPGAVTITGLNATLTKNAAGLEALVCTPGTFAIAGQAATLRTHRELVAQPGAVAVSGQAATLAVGRALLASPGAVTISGQLATLRVARRLEAQAGQVTITGQNATLTYSEFVAGTPGPHPLSVEFTPIRRTVEFTAITRTVEFTPITRTVEFTDG